MLVALGVAFWPLDTLAHDPSAWGGLFRTRDGGATWSAANAGSFVSGAIALAVSPVDPNHLLLATDSGVSRSRNGGRDWELEAPDVLVGPAFAAAHDADGQRALVSVALAIFGNDGDGWRAIRVPADAAPARALVAGPAPGRVYLAGWSGLYRSDDWGASWQSVSDGLPEGSVDALVVAPGPAEAVFAIAGGHVWASFDWAGHWQLRSVGLPSDPVQSLTLESSDPMRVWAVAAGQLFHSADRGERWQPVGRPLPERNTTVREFIVSGSTILAATDRGVFRSPDGGEHWESPEETLPAHLEAGFLMRDPTSPSTIYAGFTLTAPDVLRRQVVEGRSALMRLGASNLAGGAAFVALLMLGAIAVLRRLARSSYRSAQGELPAPVAGRPSGSSEVAR